MQGMRQPLWRTSALALAMAVLAVACGGGEQTASGGCPPDGVAIAFFGPLTGPNSPQLGINIRDGAKLAVAQYNAGSPDCEVELIEFDSQADEGQAPGLAQEAATDERIVAILGPTYSGESAVADPIFAEAGLPTITASATNPGLAQNGWDVFHRAVVNDDAQGPAAAQHIKDGLKAQKVAVIDDKSPYGLGLADSVRSELGSLVVHDDAIDTAAQDYSSTVNGVRAAGVDAIFFGGYYQQGGLLLKQLRDAGVNAAFVSGDGSRDERLIAIAGESAAQGALLTCPCAPNDTLQSAEEFLSAYQEAVGHEAGIYSAEGFDAANMLLAAIDGDNLTREAVNTYLNEASYDGLTKTLKFQENGEISGGQIFLYEVRGQELVGVGPIG